MSRKAKATFRCNDQMHAALVRQAQVHQDPVVSVLKRGLRAYLSQLGWNTDYLDGIEGAPPKKDGSNPFPDGWNQRDGSNAQ